MKRSILVRSSSDSSDEGRVLAVVAGMVACPAVHALGAIVRRLRILTGPMCASRFDAAILKIVVRNRMPDLLAVFALQNLFLHDLPKVNQNAAYRLDGVRSLISKIMPTVTSHKLILRPSSFVFVVMKGFTEGRLEMTWVIRSSAIL